MVTVKQLDAKAQLETLADKLLEIKALPLIDALADTLPEVKTEAPLHGQGDTVA